MAGRIKQWLTGHRWSAAQPLRAELFREVLIVGVVALFAQGMLLWFGGVPWTARGPRSLTFMTLQPAVWLLVAMFIQRRNGVAARAFLFTGIVETVILSTVAFPYAQFGAAVVLTI